MGFGPMTGPKRPMMGPKHLATHRASIAKAAATRRVAVHMQHLLDSSLVAKGTTSDAPEAQESQKDLQSDALVLPLLAMSRVPFPTIRHTFKCTPHQAQVVAAALSSQSRQVMLSTSGLVGKYGSRALVESFNENNASATIMCTHRCVITAVNTPKSRLLGSPSVLPGRRYESTLLRVDSALPSTPMGHQQTSESVTAGLRKGEVKVVMPGDVLGPEEELTACLVVRVRNLLAELRAKCELLETNEARQFLSILRATNPGWDVPSSPVRLSWFATEVLPFSLTAREALLTEDSVTARLDAAATLMELLLQTDMMPEQAEEPPAAVLDQVEPEDTRNPQLRRPHTSKSRLLGSPSDPPEGKSDLRIDKGRGFLEDPIVWQSNVKVPAMSVAEAAKMFLKKAVESDFDDIDDDCD